MLQHRRAGCAAGKINANHRSDPQMQRRNLLGTAAATAAATGLATPALSQGRTEWRMVTIWPRNLPGPGVAAQRCADRIGQLSGGRLTVRLFAAGEVVPAPGEIGRAHV